MTLAPPYAASPGRPSGRPNCFQLRRASELLRQPGLLQDLIRRVARFDLAVDRKILFGKWAVPDIVVALPAPYKRAAGSLQGHSIGLLDPGAAAGNRGITTELIVAYAANTDIEISEAA